MEKLFLQNLLDQHFSMAKIANKNGCSIGKVRHWMKKHGLVATGRQKYNEVDGFKTCPRCAITKPVADFFARGGSRGRGPSSYCRHCVVNWTRDRKRAFKLMCLDYKGGRACNRCGYDRCVAALEFHHTDDDKEFGIADLRIVSLTETVKRELNKCEILCSNCHKEHHFQE